MRFLLALLSLVVALPAAAQTCGVPRRLDFEIQKQVQRDRLGFTEGLEMQGGVLWESTGDLFGNTAINRIDLGSGRVKAQVDNGHRFFGEGLTFFDGRIYQMSWREHRVLVFDRHFKPLSELHNPREGWGLTHDATRLIASDGSSRLFFLSPRDFSTLSSLEVVEDGHPLGNLNELEYVGGAVWANVFGEWRVVRIDPASGCVTAWADLWPLHERMPPAERRRVDAEANFVPNGIAHDPANGQFILTGKYWSSLYFGRFVERP